MSNMYTLPSGEEVEIDKDNFIEAEIVIDLCEAVDRDLDGFLDYISDLVTNTCMLSDFSYRVIGVTPEGALIMKVCGDITDILNWEKEEEEDNV